VSWRRHMARWPAGGQRVCRGRPSGSCCSARVRHRASRFAARRRPARGERPARGHQLPGPRRGTRPWVPS
jgi:hypothetical protein